MTDREQKKAAKEFKEYWKDKGYEKGMSQPFWLSLLRDVYGVEKPERYIVFEEQVKIDSTSFIDGMIPETKVLIEQKSLGKNLNNRIKQSDNSYLTPFQQAKKYIVELPVSQHPKWVITCNFGEFNIYDMENPSGEPEVLYLEDLDEEYYRLNFLVDRHDENTSREMEISLQAGDLVGKLYDEILKQYNDPDDEKTLRSLNVLCVRLVFCMYADDAGIFKRRNQFHAFIKKIRENGNEYVREAIIELFKVMNQKEDERDPYANPDILDFPYVNGGLFSDMDVIVPRFNERIVSLLLDNTSGKFKWKDISPTIFGAVFESTLSSKTRIEGGMHYTSIKDIHKVIDPLFLDGLNEELEKIMAFKTPEVRVRKLRDFQLKLSQLKFLDPACGSGNFLTETYLCLRRLENRAIREIIDCERRTVNGQVIIGAAYNNPVKVKISQFYGIEINDFAVTVAKTALWISESQMLEETEKIILHPLKFLPLTTNAFIVEGNALTMDWDKVVNKYELSYIMGNPPFVGARLMNKSQKDDISLIFGKTKGIGNLDYVTAWYLKTASFIKMSNIKAAFVSTNSITQGLQPYILWGKMFNEDMDIDFAYQTFRWNSEASSKAHVYCVIIGFSRKNNGSKVIYKGEYKSIVKNISPYIIDAPSVLISERRKPISYVPEMVFGSMPNDGGYLSNFSEDEYKTIIKQYPKAECLFRPFIGAYEYLNNKKRWCLWLVDADPGLIKSIPPVRDAVNAVYKMRIESNRESTRKLAEESTLFGEIRQPESDYLIIPRHTSEKRRYIPYGYISKEYICGDSNLLIPNATLYDFGVLISNVHMDWVNTVCGRLEMRYRYSNNLVYNNFPWCEPTSAQRAKIEVTAQEILDARMSYANCSLAELYDDLLMPKELKTAHQNNDRAVMEAYGFTKGKEEYTSKSARVAALMRMYQEKTSSKT